MDIITTISFSLYSNKGVYALLLGSGISKSAGIPTGWDIVKDLIIKLAALEKEEKQCDPDPEKWFKSKYGEEPDYSVILSKLVSAPSERINLLKKYIEPTEEEREQNIKEPTIAHKSIAKLIKSGYIKVVITTNFDRLLEKALQAEGIEPTVIRHSDDIDGAIPLVHNSFTLIKINGDYLDSRFLNTKEELAEYQEKLHNYLLRIINEYGVISCGWSAKWDTGLINVIRQSENFRFSSYWTYVEKCEKELLEISNHRKGQTLQIKDADSFFNEISERIKALESINDDHPLNADIAVARLKTYIAKDEYKIHLHDLLQNERENAYKRIRKINDLNLAPESDNILSGLKHFESSLDSLLRLVINGVYWSKPDYYNAFIDIILRIAEPITRKGKIYTATENIHYYPALLILYSLGITAIKVRKFDLLTECFKLKIDISPDEYSQKIFLIDRVNANMVQRDFFNQILSENYKTPLSTYVDKLLRPYFKYFMPCDREYKDIFDIFEYMLSLNYMFLIGNQRMGWAPHGQFVWRSHEMLRSNTNLLSEFLSEGDQMKKEWLPLKSGMFEGNYEKYIATKNKLDKFIGGIHFM